MVVRLYLKAIYLLRFLMMNDEFHFLGDFDDSDFELLDRWSDLS